MGSQRPHSGDASAPAPDRARWGWCSWSWRPPARPSAHAILESTTPTSGEAVAQSPKDLELDFSEPVEVSLARSGCSTLRPRARRRPIPPPLRRRHPGRGVVARPRRRQLRRRLAGRVGRLAPHQRRVHVRCRRRRGSGDARGLVARLVNASGSPVVGAIFAAIKWAGYATVAAGHRRPGVRSPWIGGARGLARHGPRPVACVDRRRGRHAARHRVPGRVRRRATAIAKVLDPSLWWDVAPTRFGHARTWPASCLFVVAALLARWVGPIGRLRRRGTRSASWRCRSGWRCRSRSPATPTPAAGCAVAMSADVVHVLAFSVWLGGLWALARVGRCATARTATRRPSDVIAAVATVLRTPPSARSCWSRPAASSRGVRQVGEWSAAHLDHVRPAAAGEGRRGRRGGRRGLGQPGAGSGDGRPGTRAGARGRADAVDGGSDDGDDEPVRTIARRYLRRSVGVEVAGIVVVLVMSTLLSSVIPARRPRGSRSTRRS